MPKTYGRCDECRHWHLVNAAGTGQCRRRAPAPFVTCQVPYHGGFEAMIARWPLTRGDDGCWQYKPAADPPPETRRLSLPQVSEVNDAPP